MSCKIEYSSSDENLLTQSSEKKNQSVISSIVQKILAGMVAFKEGVKAKFDLKKGRLNGETVKPYIRYGAATSAVGVSKLKHIQQFGYTSMDLKGFTPPKGMKPCKETDSSDIHKKHTDSVYYDPKTGFKVLFVEDKNTGEVIVSFGAFKGSDVEHADEETQKKRRKANENYMWYNLLGGVPKLCTQASEFVQALKKHPSMKGKTMVCTGVSMGGMLAQYAAIDNEVKAVCLNPVSLGRGPQRKLGKEKLKKAEQFVFHISAKGDFASDSWLSNLFDRINRLFSFAHLPENFGKRVVIPSAYTGINATHMYILGSMMKLAGYGKRQTTKPPCHREKPDLDPDKTRCGLDGSDPLFKIPYPFVEA